MTEHRAWHDAYPQGVRPTIPLDTYASLTDFIGQSLQKYADLPAYENMGKSLTYREIDTLSTQFAAYLQSLGLQAGDRVAVQMPNVLQYPVVMFGIIRAGLVVVNTNPLYTAREMAHQFEDSGAKAVVILANFADKLEEVLPETHVKHVIVTEIGDLMGGLKGSIVNFMVKYVKKMVPKYHLPQAVSIKTALAKGAKETLKPVHQDADTIAFLQYTGGTTGRSKGATLTHGNLLSNLLQTSEWNGRDLIEGKEVAITALPMYHIFACTINCLLMTKFGAKNILITNPRDIPGFIKELSKHPFTFITGVNTLFNALLNAPGFADLDFSHMKLSIGGGMAVQKPVNDKWKSITGKPILEGYGLSETSPVLTFNPTNGTDRIGTIGLPMPDTDLKIMDDDGNEVPLGERGEICAKGPQVMTGYWERPDENEASFHHGAWFRTGDIGIMDEDGFFRIVDRKKDMILVSGFNVYPNEIEDVVAGHPGVLECAAIGVPDPKSNEAVKLVVVKKEDSLTKEELIAFCRENLTGYKVPRHVEFRDEMPKTAVGKILRRKLKEA
ncbi:AMP-binding protein [Pontibacter sp. G13]|uniref:AMP-binding protein n=1 Tax=Pontibacter sp. G13 TaxID=3074898 RepID=UPI00288B8476|nr:AMP-binding protein [Pontibacter sp. G13]WNJ19212.1 AMP-binding protein [Pontibacter sp. G13]